MSIYCTLWEIQLLEVNYYEARGAEIIAQAVPGHIKGDFPYLPPTIDSDDEWRAVVFVCAEHEEKGTKRCGQEYQYPLLTLSGKEYLATPFQELLEKIEYAVVQQRNRHGCRGAAPISIAPLSAVSGARSAAKIGASE